MTEWLTRYLNPTRSPAPDPPAGRRTAGATGLVYAFAILVGCLAVLVRYSLDAVLGTLHPYIFNVLGVVLVSWYGGMRPGLVVTGVTAVLSVYLFVEPEHSLALVHSGDVIGLVVFLATGVAVAVLGQLQFSARRRLIGQMAALHAASAAVAEEKQVADRALAQLDALVRNAPYSIAFLDEELRAMRVNESFARANRIAVEDHFGRRLPELTPDIPSDLLTEYHEVLAGGPPLVGRIVAGGERVWEVSAFQVPIDQDRVGLGVIGQDVTDRHRAAERVRESEARLRAMADGIPQLAWMARPDGHIFWYNQRWYDYTGTTPEEMEGWGWEKVHDPGELARVGPHWRAALAAAEPWEDTFPLRRHDGQMRWHLSRAAPYKDDAGRVLLWFGTNTDVTAQRELEQALRDAQRFSEGVLHSLPTSLAVIDADGTILAVNESWQRFGRGNGLPDRHAWEGANYFDASRHDRQYGEPAVAGLRAVARGERDTFELEYPCHGPAEERHFLLRASRFRGDGPVRVVVTHENVTNRVRAEREVRESERRFRQLAEAMPQIVWVARADGHREYYNSRWYEFTGLSEAQSLSRDGWVEALHPDDRERGRAAWVRSVETGAVYEIEYRFRGADGHDRWFLGRAVPVRDDGGRVVRWLGTCTDIDDRKKQAETLERLVTERTAALHQANAELVQQQTFVDAILDNVAEGIVACDADGRLKLFNAATRTLHGLPAEPLTPDRWAEHYSLFEADGVTPMPADRVPLTRAWHGEPVRDAELVIRPADPALPERFVLCTGQPLRTPAGEPFGAVVSMRDVTQRREYERQLVQTASALEASNEDLEKFAYIASHDLQEPLRKIQAFGDRLATKFRPALGDQGKDYIDRMLDSAGRMRRLIEDLLAFSRVNTRSRPSVPVDLNEVVRDVLSDL